MTTWKTLGGMLLALSLLTACSSSDELGSSETTQKDEDTSFQRVDREEPIIPETDEPVKIEMVEDEDVPAVEKPVPVRTPETGERAAERDEPASTTPPKTSTEPSVAPRAGTMMWSVQLGAFKHESGAFELIEEAKKKFNHPVYKRYDPASGYYKVTLGSFQDREHAGKLKTEVQSLGYPDAFLVEVAR